VSIGIAGLFGAVVGRGVVHRWSLARALVMCCVVCWPPITLLTVIVLSVFTKLRATTFQAIDVQAEGLSRLVRWDAIQRSVDWALRNWLLTVPAFQLAATVAIGFVSWRVCGLVARRVGRTLVAPVHDAEPLPLTPGAITVVVGPNGSGKTTRLRATQRAHPGAVLIAQQPVATVAESSVDAEVGGRLDLLGEAGLDAFVDRDPSTLSGGQLQRLAFARLLAQRPSIVLTDESTSMLDADGRAWAWDVLRRLAADGAAVVHVSHLDREVADADHVVSVG
jgi:energy-coupling factor transport system permease/ATP-binding protein